MPFPTSRPPARRTVLSARRPDRSAQVREGEYLEFLTESSRCSSPSNCLHAALADASRHGTGQGLVIETVAKTVTGQHSRIFLRLCPIQ